MTSEGKEVVIETTEPEQGFYRISDLPLKDRSVEIHEVYICFEEVFDGSS